MATFGPVETIKDRGGSAVTVIPGKKIGYLE